MKEYTKLTELLMEFDEKFTYKDDKNDHPIPEVSNGLMWGDVKNFITLAYNTGRKHQSQIDISALPEEEHKLKNAGYTAVQGAMYAFQEGRNSALSKSKENLIKESEKI